MMHTELYCDTLEDLSLVDSVRAMHQAWLQLSALNENVDCEHFNNQPALDALAKCLGQAGHPAFKPEPKGATHD